MEVVDNLPSVDTLKPTAIVCKTVKGKGVSFMEKNIGWHAGSLDEEDMRKALADIEQGRGSK